MLRLLGSQTVPREEQGSTWLEVFFDLVYVAILIELGNRLSGNLTLDGVLEFAFLFVPIWWSWLGLVFYTRYFPSDDIGQRLLTVLYMGAMIVLAFEIHAVSGQSASAFILAYAATKIVLALMYARAWAQFPEYRQFAGHYAFLYSLIALLWLAIAVIAPTNFWLWSVVIVIDIFIPLIISGWFRLRDKEPPDHPPLKHHYLLHRFGELTIIVLGEFFVKLITSSSGRELQPFNFFMGAGLLLISVSIWWLYFDHTDHTHLDREHTRPAIWIYTHYFLLSAITAYGVVGTKVFAAVPGEILSQEKRLLLCITLAIAVLALGVIDWASPEDSGRFFRRHHLNIRIASAFVLLLLSPVGGFINVGLLVTLVAIVLVAQVGVDIAVRLGNKSVADTVVAH